jgi:xylan 1,4-beta-xylosidase
LYRNKQHTRLLCLLTGVRDFSLVTAMTLAGIASVGAAGGQASSADETIVVDANAPAHPFPHIWEEMFGSGRAVLSLRQSYRSDLTAVKKITGFKYVRFHAIFHDDMGAYDEDAQGRPVYNFPTSIKFMTGFLKMVSNPSLN